MRDWNNYLSAVIVLFKSDGIRTHRKLIAFRSTKPEARGNLCSMQYWCEEWWNVFFEPATWIRRFVTFLKMVLAILFRLYIKHINFTLFKTYQFIRMNSLRHLQSYFFVGWESEFESRSKNGYLSTCLSVSPSSESDLVTETAFMLWIMLRA